MAHPHALPNAALAVVPEAKLRDYALNPAHPRGGPKSRVFAAALGYTQENWQDLARAILDALADYPAVPRASRPEGHEFTVDLPVSGPAGHAKVRTGWMIDAGREVPRLTTLYVCR